jgi:hypothetical protein
MEPLYTQINIEPAWQAALATSLKNLLGAEPGVKVYEDNGVIIIARGDVALTLDRVLREDGVPFWRARAVEIEFDSKRFAVLTRTLANRIRRAERGTAYYIARWALEAFRTAEKRAARKK